MNAYNVFQRKLREPIKIVAPGGYELSISVIEVVGDDVRVAIVADNKLKVHDVDTYEDFDSKPSLFQ